MNALKIGRLEATIGKKRYRLVPSGSGCVGCDLQKTCLKGVKSGEVTIMPLSQCRCPVFNDYTLASDIDVIFKEIKTGGADAQGRSYCVCRTLVDSGSTTQEILDRNCHDAASCRKVIARFLKGVYGDAWKSLHGDDVGVDENGMPYYFFDMGEGCCESIKVLSVRGRS